MTALEILKKKVNALMEERGWTSNKPVIAASGGRLSNGTLGRIRKDGENVRISQLDELAAVFGVPVYSLLDVDAPAAIGAQIERAVEAASPPGGQGTYFTPAQVIKLLAEVSLEAQGPLGGMSTADFLQLAREVAEEEPSSAPIIAAFLAKLATRLEEEPKTARLVRKAAHSKV